LNRSIEIIFSPMGETRLETKGFAGNSCREASQLLELALGTKAKEQLTPEFYAQVQAPQRIQQGS
jgi:hypothetical protein